MHRSLSRRDPRMPRPQRELRETTRTWSENWNVFLPTNINFDIFCSRAAAEQDKVRKGHAARLVRGMCRHRQTRAVTGVGWEKEGVGLSASKDSRCPVPPAWCWQRTCSNLSEHTADGYKNCTWHDYSYTSPASPFLLFSGACSGSEKRISILETCSGSFLFFFLLRATRRTKLWVEIRRYIFR